MRLKNSLRRCVIGASKPKTAEKNNDGEEEEDGGGDEDGGDSMRKRK